jgi:hypothetical protein
MEDDDVQGWKTVKGSNRFGGGHHHHRVDIATARNFNKEDIASTTTFFFTNFPESYGAKALFNAFHNHGEIKELVIPVNCQEG